MTKVPIPQAIYEIAAIVFVKFPPLVKLWATVVVLVNAAALLFVTSIYAQVALLAVTFGIFVMSIIYRKHGFVRLLGIGHILWIPMLPWMATELSRLDSGSWLYRWMVVLIVINTICLLVDAIDVTRFLKGERQPHYRWP